MTGVVCYPAEANPNRSTDELDTTVIVRPRVGAKAPTPYLAQHRKGTKDTFVVVVVVFIMGRNGGEMTFSWEQRRISE